MKAATALRVGQAVSSIASTVVDTITIVEHIAEGNDIADEDATAGIVSGHSELPAAGKSESSRPVYRHRQRRQKQR